MIRLLGIIRFTFAWKGIFPANGSFYTTDPRSLNAAMNWNLYWLYLCIILMSWVDSLKSGIANCDSFCLSWNEEFWIGKQSPFRFLFVSNSRYLCWGTGITILQESVIRMRNFQNFSMHLKRKSSSNGRLSNGAFYRSDPASSTHLLIYGDWRWSSTFQE